MPISYATDKFKVKYMSVPKLIVVMVVQFCEYTKKTLNCTFYIGELYEM